MPPKYCLDANILMTFYSSNYPYSVFPGLYKQLEEKIPDSSVILSNIFDQMRIDEALMAWLKSTGIKATKLPRKAKFVNLAEELIDKYKPNKRYTKGVDENDLKLVAYAKAEGLTVVTYESEQPNKPVILSKYQIPAVCEVEKVNWLPPISYLSELEISVG